MGIEQCFTVSGINFEFKCVCSRSISQFALAWLVLSSVSHISICKSLVLSSGTCSVIKYIVLSLQIHPGTSIYITNRFSGWSSLEPMWHQVEELGADLLSISADHPEGIHLIGIMLRLPFYLRFKL